jgi:hypothetical protein
MDTIANDKLDVELTFLKKAVEDYYLLAFLSRSEQGEKRGRTNSDENNLHYNNTVNVPNTNILCKTHRK